MPTNSPKPSLDTMPFEILYKIIEHLLLNDMSALKLTTKRNREAVEKTLLLPCLLGRTFPGSEVYYHDFSRKMGTIKSITDKIQEEDRDEITFPRKEVTDEAIDEFVHPAVDELAKEAKSDPTSALAAAYYTPARGLLFNACYPTPEEDDVPGYHTNPRLGDYTAITAIAKAHPGQAGEIFLWMCCVEAIKQKEGVVFLSYINKGFQYASINKIEEDYHKNLQQAMPSFFGNNSIELTHIECLREIASNYASSNTDSAVVSPRP